MNPTRPGYRVVVLACAGAFAMLLAQNLGFVLDDAFISYRYSKNLAEGSGLVWNVGEDPVEGYTSFLWVLIHAPTIALGLEPVLVSKAVGAVASLLVVAWLAFACRGLPAWLTAAVVGGVALSPVFALLALQGLETALAALLLLAASALAVGASLRPSWSRLGGLLGVVFAAGLTRPDSFAFSGGLLVALCGLWMARRQWQAFVPFVVLSMVFAVPGALYMVWRLQYFGYWLPNTFYIKMDQGGSWIKPEGQQYAGSFLLELALPYLVLALWLAVRRVRRTAVEPRRESVGEIVPIVAGLAVHALYLLTLQPIQGFFWRYAIPILPPLFYAIARLASRGRAVRPMPKAAALCLIGFFAFWNLRFLPEAAENRTLRSQHDRVQVGKALAGTQGTMLTSAAGAIPFYSGWRAEDLLGLVSETVAHEGVTREYLEQLAPDLIVMLSPEPNRLAIRQRKHRLLERFMLDEGFVAVAAVHRSRGLYLFYFVDASSPIYKRVACRLRTIQVVDYGDLSRLMVGSDLPFLRAVPVGCGPGSSS